MPPICKNCKNKEDFTRHESTDYDNFEEDDYEESCSKCGSSNVEDVDDDEWEAWEGPEEEKPIQTNWKEKLSVRKKC